MRVHKRTIPGGRPPPDRRTSRLRLAIAMALLITIAPQTQRFTAAQTISPAMAISPGQSVSQWLATLRNAQAERRDRVTAATRLLEACREPDTARQVIGLLGPQSEDPAARGILLEAAARKATLVPELLATLSDLASAVTPEELPAVLAAMSSVRTPEAALRLAAFLGDPHPPVVRQAATAALVRLSSKEEFAADADAMTTWLDVVRRSAPGEWAAMLIRDFATRTDRLVAERDAIAQQYVALLRRHYQDQSLETRQQMIAEMFRHARDEVRTLGFELARSELERTPRLNGQVSSAAIELLRDRNPRWRERAAALLDQLAPADAGPAVVDALNRETDPRAAAALLTAATRWPSIATIPTSIRWLEHGSPTRRASALLALALIRQGLLTDQADLARLAHIMRSLPDDQHGSVTLRLFMAVGNEDDRRRIAAMMVGAEPSVRQAAAVALADRPEGLDLLLVASVNDVNLYQISADAIIAHRPDRAGFEHLSTARPPGPEVRDAALLRLAAAMPIPDLVAVAQRQDVTNEMRVSMLTRLTEPSTAENGVLAPHLLLGLMLLAEAHLDLRRADLAMIAIDAAARIDVPPDSEQAARVRDIRATALIAENKLAEALALGASVRAWIEGLSHATDRPYAREIVDRIRQLFAGIMTPEELAALTELERAIPDGNQAESPPPDDPPILREQEPPGIG